jgi:hypothetical protein
VPSETIDNYQRGLSTRPSSAGDLRTVQEALKSEENDLEKTQQVIDATRKVARDVRTVSEKLGPKFAPVAAFAKKLSLPLQIASLAIDVLQPLLPDLAISEDNVLALGAATAVVAIAVGYDPALLVAPKHLDSKLFLQGAARAAQALRASGIAATPPQLFTRAYLKFYAKEGRYREMHRKEDVVLGQWNLILRTNRGLLNAL